jgi:competence protein ComEC
MTRSKLDTGTAELTIINVGQGAASVLRLADDSVFIFDAGPASSVERVLEHLAEINPTRIRGLLLSHNDRDHTNGVIAIIQHFGLKIEKFWMLVDRDPQELEKHSLIFDLSRRGALLAKPQRAEIKNLRRPGLLYRDTGSGIVIALRYPDLEGNEIAIAAADPNLTSAIATIRVGTQRAVIPGDAPLEAWKRLTHEAGRKIECNLILMPHHGAAIGQRAIKAHHDIDAFLNLISTPRFAAISVGHTNTYGHPSPGTIATLSEICERVVCTEYTTQCSGDAMTGSPSGARDCFGNITYRLSTHAIELSPEDLERHDERIDAMATPLCRTRRRSTLG